MLKFETSADAIFALRMGKKIYSTDTADWYWIQKKLHPGLLDGHGIFWPIDPNVSDEFDDHRGVWWSELDISYHEEHIKSTYQNGHFCYTKGRTNKINNARIHKY